MSDEAKPSGDNLGSRLGSILVIGGGRMGQAMLAGMIDSAGISAADVTVANPGEEKRRNIELQFGVRCVADASQAPNPDTAILAIKPQVLPQVLSALVQTKTFSPKRIISVAAGISTSTISSYFPDAYVIRAMPNTPLMVGQGMVGVSVGENTPESEGELACELFRCMGDAVLLDESLQDGVVAISGSGPAYFALFVSALAQAGTSLGIPADLSLKLASATMAGTATLLDCTGKSPDELIDAVSSPGGTTVAALDAMRQSGVVEAISSGVTAAARRSKELAQGD